MARFEANPLVPVRGVRHAPRRDHREVLQDIAGLDDAAYQRLLDEQMIGEAYDQDAR